MSVPCHRAPADPPRRHPGDSEGAPAEGSSHGQATVWSRARLGEMRGTQSLHGKQPEIPVGASFSAPPARPPSQQSVLKMHANSVLATPCLAGKLPGFLFAECSLAEARSQNPHMTRVGGVP